MLESPYGLETLLLRQRLPINYKFNSLQRYSAWIVNMRIYINGIGASPGASEGRGSHSPPAPLIAAPPLAMNSYSHNDLEYSP